MGKGGASPEDQVGIHWVQVKVRLFADAAGQGPIMTSPLTLERVKALAKKGQLATLCQWFQKWMEPEPALKAGLPSEPSFNTSKTDPDWLSESLTFTCPPRDQLSEKSVDFPTGISYTASLGAGVAQLVEHQPSKLRVAGSNPVSRSKPFSSQIPSDRGVEQSGSSSGS